MSWFGWILSLSHVTVLVICGRPDAGEMETEAASFLCYVCTFTWNPLMKSAECIHAPRNVTTGSVVVPCKKYCTTQRQFDYDLMEVRSFGRFCGEDAGNFCQEEPNFYRQNCFTSCQAERCNDGNGIPVTTTSPRHVTQNPFREGEEGKGKERKDALPKWNDDWDKVKSAGCHVTCVGMTTVALVCFTALRSLVNFVVT